MFEKGAELLNQSPSLGEDGGSRSLPRPIAAHLYATPWLPGPQLEEIRTHKHSSRGHLELLSRSG